MVERERRSYSSAPNSPTKDGREESSSDMQIGTDDNLVEEKHFYSVSKQATNGQDLLRKKTSNSIPRVFMDVGHNPNK